MKHRKIAGFSLLEVMVAITILSTLVYGTAQFFGQSNRLKARIKTHAIMQTLALDIENKVKTPQALYMSLPPNSNMRYCILGTLHPSQHPGCTTDMTSFREITNLTTQFTLQYPSTKNTYQEISNAYYQQNGSIFLKKNGQLATKNDCKSAADCTFYVTTYWYANCPSDGQKTSHLSCTQGAESLNISYQVKLTPLAIKKLGVHFKPIPEYLSFFSISVEKILGSTFSSSCNPGAAIIGYHPNGKPKCECKYPYVKTSHPKTQLGVVCQMSITKTSRISCSGDLVFRGLNKDGTPDCRSLSDAYECYTAGGSIYVSASPTPTKAAAEYSASNWSQSLTGNCSAVTAGLQSSYWINTTQFTSCTFNCFVGKGGGSCRTNYFGPGSTGDNRLTHRYIGVNAWLGTRTATGYRPYGVICSTREITCCRPKF